MISVLMSTYNEEIKELSQAIDSILGQSYQDLEFIIVNDNPENTQIKEILEGYEKRDARIRLIFNEENIGLAKSLNKALQCANGEYIARMDADDISLTERFEKQLKFLTENNLDLVSSSPILIDENGAEYPEKRQRKQYFSLDEGKMLRYRNIIVHPSVLGKRTAFTDVGGYRAFPSAQDYELWLRMSSVGKKIGCMEERLLKYRIRKNSISSSKTLQQFMLRWYAQDLYDEREKNDGQDSYSEENLQKYMSENLVDEAEEIQFFSDSMRLYREWKGAFQNKRVFYCLGLTMKLARKKPYGKRLLAETYYRILQQRKYKYKLN